MRPYKFSSIFCAVCLKYNCTQHFEKNFKNKQTEESKKNAYECYYKTRLRLSQEKIAEMASESIYWIQQIKCNQRNFQFCYKNDKNNTIPNT